LIDDRYKYIFDTYTFLNDYNKYVYMKIQGQMYRTLTGLKSRYSIGLPMKLVGFLGWGRGDDVSFIVDPEDKDVLFIRRDQACALKKRETM
jgi:hypothetical protein